MGLYILGFPGYSRATPEFMRASRPLIASTLRACSRCLIACVLFALASETSSHGCNIPVFRYGLERWPADPFLATVTYSGDPTEVNAFKTMVEKSGANLEVQLLESGTTDVQLKRHFCVPDDPARLPWLTLQGPAMNAPGTGVPTGRGLRRRGANPVGQNPGRPPTVFFNAPVGFDPTRLMLWTGRLVEPSASSLVDSPSRRELVEKLTSGVSVVWLLLECGDQAKDEEAARILEDIGPVLGAQLQLPAPTSGDPPLFSKLPIKLEFATVRVSRNKPEEVLFASLLSLYTRSTEPMVFPVFGRGRAMDGIPLPELNEEKLLEVAKFLTGPCSCQAKELNPGRDLLLAAKWDELIGLNAAEPTPTPTPTPTPETSGTEVVQATPEPSPQAAQAKVEKAPGSRINVGGLAAGGLVLLALSLVLLRKRR